MRFKKTILTLVIFSIFTGFFSPLTAEDTTPLEYDQSEFPQGLKDLRRFEIISLGALPFVTFQTSLFYSGVRYYKNDFDSAYMPNLFATSSYTPEEQRKVILTSLGISIGIGITDYIFQLVKRTSHKRQHVEDEKAIKIRPLNQDPDASPIPTKNYDKKPENTPATSIEIETSSGEIEANSGAESGLPDVIEATNDDVFEVQE